MLAAGENFEIWYFSNPEEYISFKWESSIQPPLEKLGDLTWKGVPFISKWSKTNTTFETLKVQLPFSKGRGSIDVEGGMMEGGKEGRRGVNEGAMGAGEEMREVKWEGWNEVRNDGGSRLLHTF